MPDVSASILRLLYKPLLIFDILFLKFFKLKQEPLYLYKNTNPWVPDNYFSNQKVRGYSLRLDLYVYEWKHILYRNIVTFAFF